jgi:FAD/FMN-containing dehydrogenase
VEDALKLLVLAQERCGAALTGFELMSSLCLELVTRHFPHLQQPLPPTFAQFVLLEISDGESEEHASALLESVMTSALADDLVQDAVVATSLAQSRSLWNLREHISEAQAAEGKNIKHDVSLPISRIGDFVRATDTLLQHAFPGARTVCFGHLGDGNLHYNVSPPPGISDASFLQRQSEVNQVVHDSVHRHGGSISAEHGLGALKREEILRYKSPLEMRMMRAVKQALDPQQLMNPGKVL